MVAVSPNLSSTSLERLVAAFAAAMHRCGAPSHVIERHVDSLLEAYGAEGTSVASPTAVWLQVGERTRVLRLEPGLVDLARLAELFRWHDALVADPPAPDAARSSLDAVLAAPPRWTPLARHVAFVTGSALAGALFGGTVADAVGGLVGGSVVLAGLLRLGPDWGPLRPLVLGAAAGAVGSLAALAGAGPLSVALASVLVLLPGLGLTLALAELAEGQLTSGSARLLGAVSTAVQLAVGLGIGASLGGLLPEGVPSVALSPWVLALVPAVAPVTFAVLLEVRPRDLPAVVGVSAAAFALATGVGGALGAGIAGLAVGLAANALARVRRIPALVTSLPGVLLLVPGSVGVRGVGQLLQEDLLGGAQTALDAIGVAGALAVGLLASHAVLPGPRPVRRTADSGTSGGTMDPTTDPAHADVARARDLTERVVEGAFSSEAKEAAAIAEARGLFERASEAFRTAGLESEAAHALAELGSLLLHGAHDRATALPLLLDAAARHGALGDTRAQLTVLLDVAEIDACHPAIDPVVEGALAAGLPGDLTGEEDPVRLVASRRDARQHDAAHALAGALVAEALARGDTVRASRMLIERGRSELDLRDRKAAVASFEQALALGEDARDPEATLRALLFLVDACWSSGTQKRARELFARAETIRGVPESLKKLRKMTRWRSALR